MATLHPIISRCVLPGTEVHSDDLASHRQTDQRINNRSAHQMIVHRLNYVGPVTMGLTPKKSNPAGTV